MNPSPELCAFR
uniref:Uncharacterized protein n=1 Tax=Anguilla anguilla TaxID=7936 RepID=A0A0E9SGU4_ANGAN